MPSFRSTRLPLLCFVPLLALILPAFAQAANFFITNNADSGSGSLRQAIEDSNSPAAGVHTITFSAVFPDDGVILLDSDLPQIQSQSLSILGANKRPRIDGQSTYALLDLSSGNLVFELSDLVLQNAFSEAGGACVSSGNAASIGSLKVDRVTFANCQVSGLSLVWGGAVYWNRSNGSSSFVDSEFLGNSATSTATEIAGQSGGGAVYSNADLTVLRTLFESNVASSVNGGSFGGAIALKGSNHSTAITETTFLYNSASPNSSILGYGGAVNVGCNNCSTQVFRSYFRGNSANYGGAVLALKPSTGSTDVYLTLTNSTFYNNTVVINGGAVFVGGKASLSASNNTFYNGDAGNGGAHIGFSVAAAEVSLFRANLLAPTYQGIDTACDGNPMITNPALVGSNLFTDASCTSLAADALANSPLGSVVVDQTPGLIPVLHFDGSAVIDSITTDSVCTGADARGTARPQDGDSDGGAYCDVGAFEAKDTYGVFFDGFES